MCENVSLIVILSIAGTSAILIAITVLLHFATRTKLYEVDELTKPTRDKWKEEKELIMKRFGIEN